MRLDETVGKSASFLCAVLSFFIFFPLRDYTLYQNYLDLQKKTSLSFTKSDFNSLTLFYKNTPRILCRILEQTELKEDLQEVANATIDRLIWERKNYSLVEKLDILATIDRLRGLDSKYEEWIVSEGLFYFPEEPHLLARQSLLNYEKHAKTALSIQDRKKALLLIENMLRSEKRS